VDKKTPGERLAALALKNIYGKNIPCNSPMATHAKVKKGEVTVFFDHTYGKLTARDVPETHHLAKVRKQTAKLLRNSPDAQLEGFALQDVQGKWYWAEKAQISGDDHVTVSSSKCPEPVRIRYDFQNNPTCNLFNQAGFPAAPFELRLR
jgi:sialate O-acetylesterase